MVFCPEPPPELKLPGCNIINAVPSSKDVIMRDFIPSALAFLKNGENLILNNFLVETAHLQSREKMLDHFKLGQGVIPASFKVHCRNCTQKTEILLADFGETAIGRVAPVDSIFRLYLSEGCDTSPDMLCADGCSMIDRRMARFFMAMRWALSLLKQDSDGDFVKHITKGDQSLRYCLHSYYWIDFQRLNDILSSLATGEQSEAMLELVEERWQELIGEVPLKICYPAIENKEWQIITGCNMEVTRWTYRNGGSCQGNNSLAESHNCQRAMILIFNACLSNGYGIPPGLFCADGCSMIEYRMGIPMLGSLSAHHNNPTQRPQSLNADFGEIATSQIAPKLPNSIRRSLWTNLLQGYTKCAIYNSVDTRSFFQRAMPGGLLLLIMSLCFPGVCDAAPAFPCDDGSMVNIMEAFLCKDGFSKAVQRLAGESGEESKPSNVATISLDDLDMFMPSYLKGIGFLRWWCETYGVRVDLSRIFRTHMVIFTTPPAGTFYFTIQYKSRSITFSLYGRSLYIMGWRNPNGTFEMKGNTCRRTKNYMAGDGVIILPVKKNYRFLAPANNVGKVRLGLYALQEAFEIVYKSHGEATEVKQAIGIFAVHLAEAGRIQRVLKDICAISQESSMDTLDSRSYNSLWVNNYGRYSTEELRRIQYHLTGEPAIKDCDCPDASEAEISELEVLQQIRIFPRDGSDSGVFKHESIPLNPHEDDSYSEDYICPKSSNSMKLRSKNRRKTKGEGLEDVSLQGDPTTFPLYLLEDWCLNGDQDKKELADEDEDSMPEKQELADEDQKSMPDKQLRQVNMSSTDIEEFIGHFPCLRRLMPRNTRGQCQLEDRFCPLGLSLVDKMTCYYPRDARLMTPDCPDTKGQCQFEDPCHSLGLRSLDKVACSYPRDATSSPVQMKVELGAIARRITEPSHPAPSILLLRGARIFSRFIRLAF